MTKPGGTGCRSGLSTVPSAATRQLQQQERETQGEQGEQQQWHEQYAEYEDDTCMHRHTCRCCYNNKPVCAPACLSLPFCVVFSGPVFLVTQPPPHSLAPQSNNPSIRRCSSVCLSVPHTCLVRLPCCQAGAFHQRTAGRRVGPGHSCGARGDRWQHAAAHHQHPASGLWREGEEGRAGRGLSTEAEGTSQQGSHGKVGCNDVSDTTGGDEEPGCLTGCGALCVCVRPPLCARPHKHKHVVLHAAPAAAPIAPAALLLLLLLLLQLCMLLKLIASPVGSFVPVDAITTSPFTSLRPRGRGLPDSSHSTPSLFTLTPGGRTGCRQGGMVVCRGGGQQGRGGEGGRAKVRRHATADGAAGAAVASAVICVEIPRLEQSCCVHSTMQVWRQPTWTKKLY